MQVLLLFSSGNTGSPEMEQKIACPLLYYKADATLKNLMPSGHSSVKPITIKHHVF